MDYALTLFSQEDAVTPEQLIIVILLAGMMGAIGQGARTIVGLKKAGDKATEAEYTLSDVFQASRLLVSLLIGFIAGVFALLALGPDKLQGGESKTQLLLGLMAAGYAGTDFIEGFMSKYLPGKDQAPPRGPSEQPPGQATRQPLAAGTDMEADAESGLPRAIG